jgi:hypothetical protein
MPERIDDVVLRRTHEACLAVSGVKKCCSPRGNECMAYWDSSMGVGCDDLRRNETTPPPTPNVSAGVRSTGTRYRHSPSPSALVYETVQDQE